MITTVLDAAAAAAAAVDRAASRTPATCRIGLLGLGNVGSAFARHVRESAPHLARRGFVPLVSTALVRSTAPSRAAAVYVDAVTDDVDDFFAEPVDVIVEALGGVEPAYTLVRRALDRGIPVVTANKSLIAAYGEELAHVARRRATALRFEASCIAGVPFLGMFARRPLAARASGVTAILNGTSNSILTAMTSGETFDVALANAQRLGFAEPDPSMDISGADAAEKLTILIRLFGRLLVDPAALPLDGIDNIEPADIAAAAAFGGAIRPVAQAAWSDRAVQAFVGPAFVGGAHPLARVGGVTNGIVIAPIRNGHGVQGAQCFIGPGAGPDVTAATLLDDVAEVVTERRVCPPSPESSQTATSVVRPHSAWFVRLEGDARESDIADLLGSYGIWTTRVERRGGRAYVLTCSAAYTRVQGALDALQAATRGTAAGFPAILDMEEPC
ncbi:MAG: homoserine dehydrogenase [Vicinamibacterales bacterium]